ncbi:protein FAR1-RELATED SEQUENCE 5-like [Mercurialis annua]|uniref:protein FAR1-RELATED SEQUENCE 5-like n=1 Tax=Mercurialis annua TaxID=3986 RepID=UPI0021609D93|nr:protein FAR1-RELATED SEQUENCE 5-like [Mercurialis annua]
MDNSENFNREEAYNLYKEYAIRIGFNVRKSISRYQVGTKTISQKEYCCSKQGVRDERNPYDTKHRNRLQTRSGCEAMIRFTVKDGVWTVTKFISTHNHEFASPSERHLLKSSRNVSLERANVLDTMINAGLRTRDAYAFMSAEIGGSDNVGFTKRGQKMTLIEAGDAQSLLNHFKQKNAEDAMFFYTIQVDQENRMTNFFWRDARSRIDYDFLGMLLFLILPFGLIDTT